MSGKEFVIVSQETVEVRTADGYFELAFALFDGCFKSDIRIVNNLRMIVEDAINTLTDREQSVLRYRFGIDCDCEKTLNEIEEILEITSERVRQIEAKAIRKLRHPSRSKRFVKLIKTTLNVGNDYKSKLRDQLYDELKDIIKQNGSLLMFWKNIMQRNTISICVEDNPYADTALIDRILSRKLCTELNDLFIFTVGELREQLDQLKIERKLGIRSLREINMRLEDVNESKELCTVVLLKNEEKIKYKYFLNDIEKIVHSLYADIIGCEKNIFSLSLSPQLSNILLLKGYIFEEDIFADVDILEEQLRNFGFEDCAEELISWKKFTEIDRLPAKPVYVCMPSDEVIEFVKQYPCMASEELLKQARIKGMTETMNIIQEVVKLDADVDEDEDDLYDLFDDEDTEETDDEIFVDDRGFLDV